MAGRRSRAAPGRTYRIPPLASFSRDIEISFWVELKRNGFAVGQNLVVDRRGKPVPIARLEAAAAELVRASPDAIVAWGAAAGHAAAVESACAIVVNENLGEIEVNAPPGLREGPFDPGHAEQIARGPFVMESKISKIDAWLDEAGRQLPVTEFAHSANNGQRPLPAAIVIAPSVNR